MPKYSVENLFPAFRKAAKFRNEMIKAGFTDNGGAIHSAERILDILCQRLKYPGLSHLNNIRKFPKAEFSVKALKVYNNGGKVFIEHVSPIRHFTQTAIKKITHEKLSDKQLRKFIIRNYRLVLLTQQETSRLNKINRSVMVSDRLNRAKIKTIIMDQV